VVDNHDDPGMAASTFRSWVIGTLLVAAGSFVNQFFVKGDTSVNVGSTVAQFLCVPPALILHRQQLMVYRG
jgi:hypothetical protein